MSSEEIKGPFVANAVEGNQQVVGEVEHPDGGKQHSNLAPEANKKILWLFYMLRHCKVKF